MKQSRHLHIPNGIQAEVLSIGKTANRNDDFVFVRPILNDRVLGVIGDFPGDSMAGTNEDCLAFLRQYVAERVDTWAEVLAPSNRILNMIAGAVNKWLQSLERPAKTTLLVLVWDLHNGMLDYVSYGDSGLGVVVDGSLRFLREGDRQGVRVAAGFLPARTVVPVVSEPVAASALLFAFTDGFWENTQNFLTDDLLLDIFQKPSLPTVIQNLQSRVIEPAVRRDDFSMLLLKGETMTNIAKDGVFNSESPDWKRWAVAEVKRQLDEERARASEPTPVERAFLQVLQDSQTMEQRLGNTLTEALREELGEALEQRFKGHVAGSEQKLTSVIKESFTGVNKQVADLESSLGTFREETREETAKQTRDLTDRYDRLDKRLKNLEVTEKEHKAQIKSLRKAVKPGNASGVPLRPAASGVMTARQQGTGSFWSNLDPGLRAGIGTLIALLLFFGARTFWPSASEPANTSQTTVTPVEAESKLDAFFREARDFASAGDYQKAVDHLVKARSQFPVPWRTSIGEALLAEYQARLSGKDPATVQGNQSGLTAGNEPTSTEEEKPVNSQPEQPAIDFTPAPIGDAMTWFLGSTPAQYAAQTKAIFTGLTKVSDTVTIPGPGSPIKLQVATPGFNRGSFTLRVVSGSTWLKTNPISEKRIAKVWFQGTIRTSEIDSFVGGGTKRRFMSVAGNRLNEFKRLPDLINAETFQSVEVDQAIRGAFGTDGASYDAEAFNNEIKSLGGDGNAAAMKKARLKWLAGRFGLNAGDSNLEARILAALSQFSQLELESFYGETVKQWND